MNKIDDEEITHIKEKLDNNKNNEDEDKYSFGFFTSY